MKMMYKQWLHMMMMMAIIDVDNTQPLSIMPVIMHVDRVIVFILGNRVMVMLFIRHAQVLMPLDYAFDDD